MSFIVNWYRQLSFFKKQLLVATVVTCITLLLAATLLYSNYAKDYKANMLANLNGKAQLLVTTSGSVLASKDKPVAEHILTSLNAFSSVKFAVLLDASKQPLATFSKDSFTTIPDLRLLETGGDTWQEYLYFYGFKNIQIFLPCITTCF